MAHWGLLQTSQDAGELGVFQARKWGGESPLGLNSCPPQPRYSLALQVPLILVTEPLAGTPPRSVTLPPPVLCAYACLPGPPSLLPHTEPPALQQALVSALLVGLVGDIGQVDTAESRAVLQNHVAYAEAQHICLQTLLQILQEPEGWARVRARAEPTDGGRACQPQDWSPPSPGQTTPSPLAGTLDLRKFGK